MRVRHQFWVFVVAMSMVGSVVVGVPAASAEETTQDDLIGDFFPDPSEELGPEDVGYDLDDQTIEQLLLLNGDGVVEERGEQTSESVHLEIGIGSSEDIEQDADSIDPGESFRVDFDVTALGAQEVSNELEVEIFLPDDVLPGSLNSGSPDWSCLPANPGSTDAEHVLTCRSSNDITAGEASSFSLTFDTDPDNAGDSAHVIRAAASVADASGGSASEASTVISINVAPEPRAHIELLGTGLDGVHRGGVSLSIHDPEPIELEVSNAGSAPLKAGEPVFVIVTGVDAPISTRGITPWTCEQRGAELTCNTSTFTELAADEALTPLVLHVAPADAHDGRVTIWSASAQFGSLDSSTAADAPNADAESDDAEDDTADLTFTVTYSLERPETLAELELIEVPREGGHGRLAVRVNEHGDRVEATTVLLAAPAGVTMDGFVGDDWSCAATGPARLGQLATCLLTRTSSTAALTTAPAGSELLVDFTVDHAVEEGSDFIVYVRSDNETASENNVTTMNLHIRNDLAPLLGPDFTVADQIDDDDEGIDGRPFVELHALLEDETDVSLDWNQVCEPGDGIDRGCRSGASTIEFLDVDDDSHARFTVPPAAETVTVRVTASDGRHVASDEVSISVADQEEHIDDIVGVAHEPLTAQQTPVSSIRRFSGATATEDLADAEQGSATATPDVVAEDAGQEEPTEPSPQPEPSSESEPPSSVGTRAAPLVCKAIDALAAAGVSDSVDFGNGIVVRFGTTKVIADCYAATAAVEFSETTIEIMEGITISGAGGRLDSGGITLNTGSAGLPDSWQMPALSIPTGFNASLGDAGSSLQPFTGTVVVDSAPFFDLDGWTETTTLNFTPTESGTQALDITATGSDGSDARFSIDGAIGSGRDISFVFTATGIVQIGEAAIDLRGDLTTTGADGAVEYNVNGSLRQPVVLADGISLQNLDVSYTPERIDGTGIVRIGEGELVTALSYTSADDWGLTAASATDWEALPGLIVPADAVNGSIVQSDGKLTVDVTAVIDETWNPNSAMSIGPTTLTIGNKCAETSCPALATISAPGSLTLGETIPFTLEGEIDLESRSADISIPINRPISAADELTLESAEIGITMGSTGFNFGLKGPADILGARVPVGFSFLPEGWVATGHIDTPTTIAGFELPTLSFAMASFDTTIDASHPDFGVRVPTSVSSIKLEPFSLTGFSGMSLPDIGLPGISLPESGGGSSNGGGSDRGDSGTGDSDAPGSDTTGSDTAGSGSDGASRKLPPLPNLGLATFSLGAKAPSIDLAVPTPDNWFLFGGSDSSNGGSDPGNGGSSSGGSISSDGSSSLRLTDVGFNLKQLPGGGASFSLNGEAELTLGDDVVRLKGDLGITTGVDAGLVGNFSLQSDGWRNAFGIDGLTVYDFAVTVKGSVGAASFGVAGVAQLPPDFAESLGMDPRTTVTLGANLGTSNSCFLLELDAPDGAQAVDLGEGTVRAQHARIGIAPTGCEIGDGDGKFSLDPGFSLAFDGEILGAPVELNAELKVAPTFGLDADLMVGAMDLGGVELGDTNVKILIEPAHWELGFKSSVRVDDTLIEVEGLASASEAGAQIDFKGRVEELNLGLVNVEEVDVELGVSTGAEPTASFALKGMISTLGTTEEIELALDMRDGIVQEANGRIAVDIDIEGTGLSGDLGFDYLVGHAPTIEGTIKLTADGFTLGEAHAVVGERGIEISGAVDNDIVGKVVLSGALVFEAPEDADSAPIQVRDANGASVTGSAGDFSLSATGISLGLSDFTMTGSVAFGSVGGESYLHFDGHTHLGGKFDVDLAGDISSTGEFAFHGKGSLGYGQWKLAVKLSAVNAQGNLKVKFNTTLKTVVATVKVEGDVERSGGKTTYELTGDQSLNFGYGAQKATFTFTQKSLTATVHLSAGSTFSVKGKMKVTTHGSFRFSATAKVKVANIKPTLEVSFTNCLKTCEKHTKVPKVRMSGTVKTSGLHFSFNAAVNPSGWFDVKLETHGKVHGWKNVAGVTATGYVSWKVKVSVNSGGFNKLLVSGSGSVWYNAWWFSGARKLGSFGFGGSVNGSGKVHGHLSFSIIGKDFKVNM